MLINQIMSFLAKSGADFAYFKFIKHGSAIFQLAIRMPSFFCRDYYPFINPHWTASMPQCFDEFMGRFSKKTRKKIRRQNNLINRRFKDNFYIKCFKSKDDLETALRDVERIASKTYQRGLRVGYDDSVQTRKEFAFATERNWLRIYILYLDGVPAAYTTGYVYGKTYVGIAQGYDPAYKAYSPGIFTVMREIESLCREGGIETYDFGYGEAFYKRQFSDKNWNDAEVYIFAPTLKGVQLNFMRSVIACVDKNVKIVLSHVNMLDWVKKKWRQKLIPTEC
jgi:CelD/BcsL family acetyltransferase involved in cellulose biosynthesis